MQTPHHPANQQPIIGTSKESNEQQLQLAKEQGKAFEQAVMTMVKEEAHGAQQRVGDYLIGYAIEEAEGLYRPSDGELRWEEPSQENAHVEIVVRDAADGRFIPGLTVFARLLDQNGKEVGYHQQPFLWHPWLYHYGRNWQVPGDGEYTLQVRVEAPDFARHDRVNGKRFAQPAEVEFPKVRIKTGQKR